LLGVLPGLVLARAIPAGQLQMTIGTLVAVSLAAIMLVRLIASYRHECANHRSGMASGFTNASAG
jgi:hypothetical protein